jgi:hypothetical protein
VLDAEPNGQTAKLTLIGPSANHGQVCARCHREEGWHRRDEAVVPLVTLQTSDRADEWRTRHLGLPVIEWKGLGTIPDQLNCLRVHPKPAGKQLNFVRAHRDESVRSAEKRSQCPPLSPTQGCPQPTGMASRVERDNGRDSGPLSGRERHGGYESVHTLHMYEVVAPLRHLTGEPRRYVQVSRTWYGGEPADGELATLLDRR